MEPDILSTPSDPKSREPLRSALGISPIPAAPGDVHHVNGNGTNGHGLNGASLNGASMNGTSLNGHRSDLAARERLWSTALAGTEAAALPPGLAAAGAGEQDRGGFYLASGKRALDVFGSAVALVLSAPVLLLAALAIKLETRGPVFYKSTRIGRGGRPFTFYKLRSMVNGADRHRHHLTHLNEADGPIFKMCNDPRTTRVGRFLRTSSIDEIPQFFHVLSGDMSLVGPRPPLPEEVAQYEPWQMRRLDVRPGLTCLWQISGRSRIGFQEWMRLDLEYIRRRSMALDLKILLRTIPAVLSREGAY